MAARPIRPVPCGTPGRFQYKSADCEQVKTISHFSLLHLHLPSRRQVNPHSTEIYFSYYKNIWLCTRIMWLVIL